MNKNEILSNIDNMISYNEKLEYLNGLFLDADNLKDEKIIMEMIKDLMIYG